MRSDGFTGQGGSAGGSAGAETYESLGNGSYVSLWAFDEFVK